MVNPPHPSANGAERLFDPAGVMYNEKIRLMLSLQILKKTASQSRNKMFSLTHLFLTHGLLCSRPIQASYWYFSDGRGLWHGCPNLRACSRGAIPLPGYSARSRKTSCCTTEAQSLVRMGNRTLQFNFRIPTEYFSYLDSNGEHHMPSPDPQIFHVILCTAIHCLSEILSDISIEVTVPFHLALQIWNVCVANNDRISCHHGRSNGD